MEKLYGIRTEINRTVIRTKHVMPDRLRKQITKFAKKVAEEDGSPFINWKLTVNPKD